MADALPFYVVMATGIPEIYMILLLGFRMFNDTIERKQAIIVCVLASLINYLTRHFGVVFGIHTVLTAFSIIIICFLLTRKNIWKISSAVVSGFAVIIFIEVLEFALARIFFSDIHVHLLNRPWLNILTALFKVMIMGILLIYVNKSNFVLFNSEHFEIDKPDDKTTKGKRM